MPEAFYILFGAAFTVLTAVALGKLLFRGLKVQFYRTEESLLAFLAGAACLSSIVFGLCVMQLGYKGVFLAIGVFAIGAVMWVDRHRQPAETLPPIPRFWKVTFGLVFAVFALIYLVNAMAPERSPDGMAYHLGLVARYYREHGFKRLTTNMYANLSQGVEMLFLYAFAFGRHSAAALVHFSFLAALPLAMLAYGRRFGFAPAAATGALLFFLSPVAGRDGTTAYNDVAVAAILFGVFHFLQIWDQERTPGLLVPIGLLAGFAYAAKYTAFLAVLYALGFLGWRLVRSRQPWLKPLLVVSLCALVLIAPWILKNWLWLGNPFSPFLNKIFPNPYVHVSLEEDWAQYLRSYAEIKSIWQIPGEVILKGRVLCGLLGPVFLLAPLSLLALGLPAGRRLLAAALIFAVTYPLNIGTRFLIPALPFLALAMGLAISRVRALAAGILLAHALASWPSNITIYSDPYPWRLEDVMPWKQALRIEPQDEFLTRTTPSYVSARMIEQFVPPGERVFVFGQVAEAYTSRDILVNYQSGFNQTIGDILWTPLIEDFRPLKQVIFQFQRQPLRSVRVVQTARGTVEHWMISEIYVQDGQNDVVRATTWRLNASPNPWDAEMALDRNPATRWRSWQTLSPGMFLELDFGRPQVIDSVRIESATAQYEARMKLEGQTESGARILLDARPQVKTAEDSPGLGPAAVTAILARGVRWLMINDTDIGAGDLRKEAAEWGITEVAERGAARLYRLDQRETESTTSVAPQPPASPGASQ